MAMGAFDQVAIQIYKTMVHKPDDVINQYTYRWIMEPYVDVDYAKKYSSNMTLRWNNLRNLSDRSFTLGGPQLLPYHSTKNPGGVKYSNMTADMLVLWGTKDNMMPEGQRHRFRNVVMLATEGRVKVQTRQVPDAGHFAGWDQPDYVAAQVLDYLIERKGVKAFGDILLGFGETTIWKGDEAKILPLLRNLAPRVGGCGKRIHSLDETDDIMYNTRVGGKMDIGTITRSAGCGERVYSLDDKVNDIINNTRIGGSYEKESGY